LTHRAVWVLAALAGGVLPGCTLIDQNTFNPKASAVPVIPAAPAAAVVAAPSGPPPLLTLRPGQPMQDAVRQAVLAARRRKPDVVFDVVAMLPGSSSPEMGLDEQTASSSAEAGTVARAIAAQGVPPGRVRLFARPEAGLAGQEVRVYVR
jgi:hypothetical protein